MSDYISRADAIEAVENNSYGMGSRASVKAIKALPSAENPKADEQKIQSGDLISRADAIESIQETISDYIPILRGKTEEIPLEIVMAINALPSADAMSKLKKPCDSLLTEESNGSKEQKSKLEAADAVQGDECDHCVYKWGLKGGDDNE